ncbi:MAG: flagellar basal body rod protein FlgC [Terracidiphilus sp.]|nr:flagellar basal body rod protein FlgC [Terracidiphilus sp.]
MNLFGIMETSGSAMQAERMRAEVVAANMANAETTRTEDGGPYKRQMVVFQASKGEAGFLNAMSSAVSTVGTLSSAGGLFSNQIAPGVEVAQVVEDPSPPLKRYEPNHPDAGPDGYVSYPDINPITEMVDLMGATRAYGLNGSAVQAEKGMISAALEIVKS